MELKEYIKIVKDHRLFFLGIWLLVVLVAMTAFKMIPVRYESFFSIDVTRVKDKNLSSGNNSSKIRDHGYDQFYYLEANDRFSKLIKQWLEDQSFLSEVFSRSNSVGKLGNFNGNFFRVESSTLGFVKVSYKTSSIKLSKRVFLVVKNGLNGRLERINKNKGGGDWFKLIFNKPSIEKKEYSFPIFALLSLIGGFLVAFFGTLIRHYLKC